MKIENTFYSALVVDNADPQKKGRIKIKISPQHDDVPNTALPWALPVAFTNMVDVPENNSTVWVIFQQGNEYEPIYLGNVLHNNYFRNGIRAENYPDTSGILYNDVWISLNRKTKKIELHSPTSSIVMDNTGITIDSSLTININSSVQVSVNAPLITCN